MEVNTKNAFAGLLPLHLGSLNEVIAEEQSLPDQVVL